MMCTLKGETTVYGYLKRIGGDRTQARLILDDGSAIRVKLSPDQVKACSHLPCQYICVEGVATWKGEALTLVCLEAVSIEPFESVTPAAGFAFLREKLAKSWSGITDVMGYVG